MIFYYIRHGDPIYAPDSLTPLGERQAEAAAKRLALYGLDKIYSSTSNRAMLTAKPTCELLKKNMELLDFANEKYAWSEFTVERADGKKCWFFESDEHKRMAVDEEILSMGYNWYEHENLKSFKKGAERVQNETFNFFKSLGYEKVGKTGLYKVVKPSNERVALFAHGGFGVAFLSEIFGIPYPVYSATHYCIRTTGMTVIDFSEKDGYSIPKVLTFSSDSHLYREGLPTNIGADIYF